MLEIIVVDSQLTPTVNTELEVQHFWF